MITAAELLDRLRDERGRTCDPELYATLDAAEKALRKRATTATTVPPKPKPKRTPAPQVARLRARCQELRDQGLSLPEIGRRVGLTHWTVMYHLREAK